MPYPMGQLLRASRSRADRIRQFLGIMLGLGGIVAVIVSPIPINLLVVTAVLAIVAGCIFLLNDTFASLVALVALMFAVEFATAKLSPEPGDHEAQAKLFGAGTALIVNAVARWLLRRQSRSSPARTQ